MRYFSTGSGSVSVIPGTIQATKFLAGDGTPGSPAYTFTSDSDVGLYRVGNNFLGVGIGGSQVTTWQAGLFASNQNMEMAAGTQLRVDPGTVGAPGLAFVGDTNTGVYRVGADSAGFSANGAQFLYWNTGGAGATVDMYVGRHWVMTETTAPSGVANTGFLYAIDVAGKTAIRVRAGAAATEATLVTEA